MHPSDALPLIWRDPADSCYIASVATVAAAVAGAPRGSVPVLVGVVHHPNCYSNLPAAAVLLAVVLPQAEAAFLRAFVGIVALRARLRFVEREYSGPGFEKLFL